LGFAVLPAKIVHASAALATPLVAERASAGCMFDGNPSGWLEKPVIRPGFLVPSGFWAVVRQSTCAWLLQDRLAYVVGS
jgi:hypothetical protein